jgi:hypothetical protein
MSSIAVVKIRSEAEMRMQTRRSLTWLVPLLMSMVLACGGNQAPSPSPTPSALIGDAATIWCESSIGAVATAALSLKIYDTPTSDLQVVVTAFDGSNKTMPMSEVLPLMVVGSEVGQNEPTTLRVTRGMRDAWLNVDRPGYERSCAAAFALR